MTVLDDPRGRSGTKRSYPAREETIGFLVWEARRAYYKEFGDRIAAHGISFGVFPVLRILWDEDSLTQADIIKRLRMKGPTIVGIVSQLEDDGLVRRIQDPNDRRKRTIELTQQGEALRDLIMPISEEVNRRAVKGFTPDERRALKSYLRRLQANLQPLGDARRV